MICSTPLPMIKDDWMRKIEMQGFYEETANSSEVFSKYPITKILWAGSTCVCDEIVIAESKEYGRMLFTDGELQSTSYDEPIYHEHLVHPAILAYRKLYGSKPLNILVLGGGEGATCRELLRYSRDSVKNIVWNDFDQQLVELCKEHLKFCDAADEVYSNSERCVSVFFDALRLLRDETLPLFDIIISDLPDPVLGEKKGLYSDEFWHLVFERTSAKCVVVTHCGPVSPGSGGMALHNYVTQGMMNAGFVTPTQGKVIIPSYQSEWSYALCTKDTQIAYWMIKDLPLEPGLKVLDTDALQSFFLVPSYYTTLQ